jgi:hypothetical protein
LKEHDLVTALNVLPFEESNIKKLESKVKKTNQLIFCQYCKKIFIVSSSFSRHYQTHKYQEYKKEIKLHLDEVTRLSIIRQLDHNRGAGDVANRSIPRKTGPVQQRTLFDPVNQYDNLVGKQSGLSHQKVEVIDISSEFQTPSVSSYASSSCESLIKFLRAFQPSLIPIKR